jgi:hypothetical protein
MKTSDSSLPAYEKCNSMLIETYTKGLLFPALVCIFYCSALLLNVTEWDFIRMGTAKRGGGRYTDSIDVLGVPYYCPGGLRKFSD